LHPREHELAAPQQLLFSQLLQLVDNSPASARLMPKRSAKCVNSSLLLILQGSAIRVFSSPLVFLG
jgi:hypothetical protein